MFQSSDGLFHFVFANQEDCFFTDSYLKLKFRPYLYYCLQENEYEHIYSLYAGDNSYFLRAVGGINRNNEENNKKKSFFSWIGKSKNDTVEKKDYISGCCENAMEISAEECSEAICEILKLMEKTGNMALVVSVNIFCELFNTKNIIRQLEKLNSSNIIVITSSCLASDNDKYFISPEQVRSYDSNKQKEKGSIFYQDNSLFPEFKRAYVDNVKLPKLVFTYDILKSTFNERVQYWNELNYDDILKIVYYNVMHGFYNNYPPELYATVLSIWYGNHVFRNKYSNILRLPENNMRTNQTIYDIIKNNKITSSVMEQIIRNEKTDDFKKILETWEKRTDNIFISNGISIKNLEHQKSASGYIIRLNKMLALNPEILKDKKNILAEIEAFFIKPSYVSSRRCNYSLPHERMSGVGDYSYEEQIIDKAYNWLESKEKWNYWDKYTAVMIYEMFYSCREDAMDKTDKDVWGDISVLCFKIWVNGIEKAMKFSQLYPDNTDYNKNSAFELYSEIFNHAESKNRDEMEKFLNNSSSCVLN